MVLLVLGMGWYWPWYLYRKYCHLFSGVCISASANKKQVLRVIFSKSTVQDIADEWGMGMNGDQLLPIHPPGGWMDKTRILFIPMNGKNENIIHPPFIPIHPPWDEWVKVYPHSSPFPIYLLCPDSNDCIGLLAIVNISISEYRQKYGIDPSLIGFKGDGLLNCFGFISIPTVYTVLAMISGTFWHSKVCHDADL